MKSIKYLCLFIWAIYLSSCTDLTDTFKEFQGDGEISYSGKLDSIVIREGYQKVQLEGFLYYARTAKELVINWNGQQKIVDIANSPKDEKLKVLIDNLEENVYVFNIYTLDKDKNRSVITTIQANAYGDKFISAQNKIGYTAEATERNTVEIQWAEISRLSRIILDYTDREGNNQQIIVNPGTKETSVSKFKAATKLKITTLVKPNENALEYIPLEPEYYDFPETLFDPEVLDRRLFRNMAMASDAVQGHGGAVANMWDGNNETYLHTADNVGVTSHVTIDTGEENNLVAGRVVMRGIYIWCPFQFQIWGLPDVEDINDHEPAIEDNLANKDAWEAESITKGWINLTDNGLTNYATRETNNHEAYFSLDNTKKVRYIRYRAVKVWEKEGDTGLIMEGKNAYFCTSELYLYRGL